MANILFIDDDPYTLATYQRAVEIFGHQALIANSAVEALDLVRTASMDLIVLDKNMPDMDGFDLISQIKDQIVNKEIPIVMVSADPEGLVNEQAVLAGAATYISKPIRLDTLMDLIRNYASTGNGNENP